MVARACVIGGGIIGAASAWHLAQGGAEVTVVEAGTAPGGTATAASWAWINASWGHPAPYVALRMAAMADWRTLDETVGGLAPDWGGGLLWDIAPEPLRSFVAERAAQGYGIRLVGGAEAARIEPALANPPALAAHAPGEGSIEPVPAARRLIAASGARVIGGVAVDGLRVNHGRVEGVRIGGKTMPCDMVLIAAGAGAGVLLAGVHLALSMTAPPGLLARTAPLPRLLNGLVMTPGFHARQLVDGSLLAGGDFGGSDPGTDPAAEAEALVAAVRGAIRGAEGARLAGYTIGNRPTPGDGLPAVGWVPGIEGLYLSLSHSGVTLAPALGRMAAAEMLHDRRDPLLNPFGPGRLIA